MSPADFLRGLKKNGPAPVYLFIGPEAYDRDRCRRALTDAVLPADRREEGLSVHDLSEVSVSEVLDDAQSLSLFASERLIWVMGAEAALPRGRAIAAASDDDEEGVGGKGDTSALAAYVRDPSPGTVLVFDCSRYHFDGDDKARIERVQKFYAPIRDVVEFRPYALDDARELARSLASARGLNIGAPELGMLVESLAGDAARIAAEIEKLALFASDRKVTAEDIAALVPDAQESTIFALVGALAAGNRAASLTALDALVRSGEYLPLALSFLGTQFRLALVAREANLRSSYDIQNHFTRMGIRIWRDRAEQVRQTMSAFPKERLEFALKKVFETDYALRDTRPDDRIVMEDLIFSLTSSPVAR